MADRVFTDGGVYNEGTLGRFGIQIFGDVTNAGAFEAVRHAGISEVTGDFTQTPDGVLVAQVVEPGFNAPLRIYGDTHLGGSVVVMPNPLYDLHVGDQLLLIDTTAPLTYSATMTSYYGGYTFEPRVAPGVGLFAVVTATPEPAAATAAVGMLSLLLSRRRTRRSLPPLPCTQGRGLG